MLIELEDRQNRQGDERGGTGGGGAKIERGERTGTLQENSKRERDGMNSNWGKVKKDGGQ